MRPWRNRQTRTFEGRVGDRTGSSPVGRTILKMLESIGSGIYFFKKKTEADYEKHHNLCERTAGFF